MQVKGHVANFVQEKRATFGLLSGYGAMKGTMRAEDYYAELIAEKRKDPTVSRQMANGFQAVRLVSGYIEERSCDNYAVLLIRENPNFKHPQSDCAVMGKRA